MAIKKSLKIKGIGYVTLHVGNVTTAVDLSAIQFNFI